MRLSVRLPLARRLARFAAARAAPVSAILGLLAAATIPLAAQAQNATIQVAWTRDYTTSPATNVCSSSGDVAGPYCTIHIHLPVAAMMFTVSSVTVTEDTGGVHTATPVTFSGPYQSGSCPTGCTQSPSTSHFDVTLWNTPSYHNRPHHIAVSGVYYIFSGMLMMTPVPFSGSADVTIANLTVAATSPANPEPILWQGDSTQPVTLTALASAAWKASVGVRLRIYASGNTQQPVQDVAWNQVVGQGTTTLTYTWNGSQTSSTETAPAGVYLFRWDLLATTQMDGVATSRRG